MKAPDKLYIGRRNYGSLIGGWKAQPFTSKEIESIEYIRKDMLLEWQKAKMMKAAVEGEVVKDISNKLAVTAKNINLDGFKFGDKVSIIVLPKEDGE